MCAITEEDNINHNQQIPIYIYIYTLRVLIVHYNESHESLYPGDLSRIWKNVLYAT